MPQSGILTGINRMIEMRLLHMEQKNNNLGFTLPEVLIAISIFAIGFLAAATMQIYASNNNRRSAEATEATSIASLHMERLMPLAFGDTDLDPAGNPHPAGGLNEGKYTIQWQVVDSDENSDGVNDAKIINLTVSWSLLLSGGSQRSVNIDFIKPDL